VVAEEAIGGLLGVTVVAVAEGGKGLLVAVGDRREEDVVGRRVGCLRSLSRAIVYRLHHSDSAFVCNIQGLPLTAVYSPERRMA